MGFQERLFKYLREKEIPFSIDHRTERGPDPGPVLDYRFQPTPIVRTEFAFIEKQLTMLVLPESKAVDLMRLQAWSGTSDLSLVRAGWLDAAFPDVDIDAIPPLGVLWQIPVLIDESLDGQETLRFYAGCAHDIVTMRRVDFERLTHPVHADLAVTKETPALALT